MDMRQQKSLGDKLMNSLLVIGAGGHGKVVAEAAKSSRQFTNISFIDDRYPKIRKVLDYPVLGKINDLDIFNNNHFSIAVAIGDNKKRVELIRYSNSKGFNTPSIIHPTAYVSSNAFIEDGTIVLPHAVINTSARIGCGAIINTGAIVEHDCNLDEGVHLSPGVYLGGGVSIGRFSWLGIGSKVIHQINIGHSVIIGAGSIVLNNIRNYVTAVGSPAKVIKEHGK